ncbi:glutathione transferase omega-1 [Dothidotthia symphoricarpi CBS 119687]|uniref:Glutathione transferase omega-1 n=1 Tax=Dothidotthia symphoricarpi CBS 119687 TaxID=1392245 RepID=A0A6A6AFE9_9PLEO|nr:glutathione transferase omega-1 [Dothidotthia symphoricarpi CBS 119687]KAF2129845.1 glutathione transferase omega-1 [Dothidotthia symphoricarpi CBS 119687]
MGKDHPDADLYPTATALAAKTVDAHKAEQSLKLYSGWFCPFVQRIWIALEEKGIPYQYIEVNPYHKPQSLLDLNPRGLVPTLQYDNKPLYESTVLCEFIEDAFPDHTPHLLPKDPYDRARTRIWTDYVGSRIIPAYHRFLQHQGDDGLKEKQQEFLNHLKEFTKEMDSEGPYFMGKEFSLIDIVIAPWANRLWVFDHFKGGSGLPEEGKGGDDEETWVRWRKWLKAVEDRKSVKETLSEREHYLPIYQRYAEDRAQSEAAKAIRAGRGMP